MGSRSVGDLVDAALRGGERRRFATLAELTSRADATVIDEACRLCRSRGKRRRVLGADILAELAPGHRAFVARSLSVLLEMLTHESDADVLAAVAHALGKTGTREGVNASIGLKSHPSDTVRFGIVMGLLGSEDKRAIRTLLELAEDEDPDVRDWATFGIGTQIDTDTKRIRKALFRRLSDENENVRAEALVGLARHHDGRAPALVLAELERLIVADEFSPLAVESAEQIRDRRCLPLLISLREAWADDTYLSHLLDDAIRACGGQEE